MTATRSTSDMIETAPRELSASVIVCRGHPVMLKYNIKMK